MLVIYTFTIISGVSSNGKFQPKRRLVMSRRGKEEK